MSTTATPHDREPFYNGRHFRPAKLLSFRKLLRFSANRSGTSAVEAAFALPVLLTFLFIAVEFGRVLYTRVELQYALYNAARFGMVSSTANAASIEQHLRGQLIFLRNDKLTDVQLVETTNSDSTKSANLSVSYHVSFIIPLISESTVTIQRSTSFLRRP